MSKNIVEQKYLTQINEILHDNGLQLFEMNWLFEYDSYVLQILVENIDVTQVNVEFDNLIAANEKISELLDNEPTFMEPYILEVASAGAEREVKNPEILINNLQKYFYLKTSKNFEGVSDFNATLTAYDPETEFFTFKFFIKGKPKTAKLSFRDINFIRFAIKF